MAAKSDVENPTTYRQRLRPRHDRVPVMARCSLGDIVLLPLDADIVRARLHHDDFSLDKAMLGQARTLHFCPEFPGDAIDLYPRFLEAAGDSGTIEGTFVVVDPRDGEVVGQLGTLGPPTGTEVEIGYGVNASAQGRGVATAAVGVLVEDLLARPGVGRVVARTAVTNPASGRVLEKNGFTIAGRESSDEGELLVWAQTTAAL